MEYKLIDDLIDLELNTEKIEDSSKKIRITLHKLLSSQDKAFEVIFDGLMFDFYLPTTQEESDELEDLRNFLIDRLMQESFRTGNWDYVLAFASGIDPAELRMEKIHIEDLYPVLDEKGERVTAIPINEEAHVVKSQRLKE